MDETTHVRSGLLGGTVRRHWRMLVIGVVGGLVLGLAATQLLSPKYASHASVYLNPLVGNPYQPDTGADRNGQLVALQTEASLLSTPEVADLARAASTLPLPVQPETRVKGVNPSNSQIITVTFTAGTPAVARAGAQAFADAYLAYRTQRAVASNTAEAAQVTASIATTQGLLDSAAASLATAAPGTAAALVLTQSVQVYGSQLANLQVELGQLTGSVPSPGQVIDPATAPTSPSGLPKAAVLLGAVIVGLALASLLALAREHADNRIHDPDELTAIGAGHPLALVPSDTSAADPAAASPEGYRLLQTLVLGRHGDGCATVCILGAAGETVPDTVATGLAATAARAGRRVLLVGPAVPASWSMAHRLTERSVRAADTWPAAPVGRSAELAVFALGPDRADLVQSGAFDAFLAMAARSRDLIVLGGGSSLTATAWRMAESADFTIVAVELGTDTFDDVFDLVESLRESHVTDIAVVGVHGKRPAPSKDAAGRDEERRSATADRPSTKSKRAANENPADTSRRAERRKARGDTDETDPPARPEGRSGGR